MIKKIKIFKKQDEKVESMDGNNKNKRNHTKIKKQDDLNNQKLVKRMSRKDLLQLLIVQRKKIDELEQELKHTNELLTSKEIIIDNAGSIAEASLKLNEVFEKAQEAANQYLENVKRTKKRK